MNFRFGWGGVAAFALLAGCTIVPETDYATRYVDVRDGTQAVAEDGTVVPREFTGEAMLSMSSDELIRFAFALERHYQELAIRADNVTHIGNGFLISAAAGLALGDAAGDAADVMARRTIAMLAGNEAIKNVAPAQLARAFRLASAETLCILTTASTMNDRSEEFRMAMITVLRSSHANLRARMARDRKGMQQLLEAFKQQNSEAVTVEDYIDLENRLRIAQLSDEAIAKPLFACLR